MAGDDWFDDWVGRFCECFAVTSDAQVVALRRCRRVLVELGATAARLDEVTYRMQRQATPTPRYHDARFDRVKELLREIQAEERVAARRQEEQRRGLFREDDRPAPADGRAAAARSAREQGWLNLEAILLGIGTPVGRGREQPRLYAPAPSPDSEPPGGPALDTSFDPAEFEGGEE